MNNDLISRNALKEALSQTPYNDYDDLTRTENLIDNAPTVEPENEYNIGFYDGFMSAKENIKKEPERLQGEWIITLDEEFYHYKCPFCGFWATGDFISTNGNLDLPNFCPNCGADMRGEKK